MHIAANIYTTKLLSTLFYSVSIYSHLVNFPVVNQSIILTIFTWLVSSQSHMVRNWQAHFQFITGGIIIACSDVWITSGPESPPWAIWEIPAGREAAPYLAGSPVNSTGLRNVAERH